jgi:hypothetical protein
MPLPLLAVFTVLVDPRLDTSSEPYAWYLFASPMDAPVFEYSELSGYEGRESRAGRASARWAWNGALSGMWVLAR